MSQIFPYSSVWSKKSLFFYFEILSQSIPLSDYQQKENSLYNYLVSIQTPKKTSQVCSRLSVIQDITTPLLVPTTSVWLKIKIREVSVEYWNSFHKLKRKGVDIFPWFIIGNNVCQRSYLRNYVQFPGHGQSPIVSYLQWRRTRCLRLKPDRKIRSIPIEVGCLKGHKKNKRRTVKVHR